MAYNTNINVGSPPLLWSDLNDAFTKVNENFDILSATMGGAGLVPVDFSSLDSNVSPTVDNLYDLGDSTHKWKSLRLASYSPTVDNDLYNGLHIGPAHITNVGSTIDLPNESTVNGELIIDPAKTFFKTIEVDSDFIIEAQGFGDIVKFISGNGVSMTVDSGAESITFDNTGILSVANGAGISVSTVSGSTTITNTGVRSLTSTTSLPSGRTAGAGINIDNSTGDGIKITNTGVLSIISGVGITVSSDAATGQVQIINSAPGGNVYSAFLIDSDYANIIQADNTADTVSFNSGLGISLGKNPATDTITFAVDPNFDLTGNVTGDLTGNVTGDVTGNVTGDLTGNVTGGNISADWFRVGTYDPAPTSSFFEIEGVGTPRVRMGGPGQQTLELRSYYSSPNIGDLGTTIDWRQSTTGTLDITLAQLFSRVTNIGNTTEEGDLVIKVSVAGSLLEVGYFNAGGFNGNVTGDLTGNVTGDLTSGNVSIASNRVTTPEIEGFSDTLAIYSDWAKNTGLSIVSTTSLESVTIESDRIVAISTGVGGTQKDWIFETSGVLTLPSGGYISGNLTGTVTGNIFTSLIDSSDSSAITVTPKMIFSSDVAVENELTIAGSRVINLTELKSVAAASTSFADFQTRIAALV